MPQAIIMIHINITNLVLISELEKDDSMIEISLLKNVVDFIQTISMIALNIIFKRKVMKWRLMAMDQFYDVTI